jgi:uncharacterized protein YndB with AHSA1/START domain/uncharacterized protein YdhG (YjbR/CyaY superfamily)
MQKSTTPVDDYINAFPEDVSQKLESIRNLIREKAPKAQEEFSYGMPAYKTGGRPLVYFAAFKNHIGLYALPTGHVRFAKELAIYRHGKGSVQFPLSQPLPLDLIGRIVEYRLIENDLKSNKMKTERKTDFIIDKSNQRVQVEWEFYAPVEKVWDAWTRPEILDQWWAPKPWKARTKSMDFRSGGFWLYAMMGPDGQEVCGKADYQIVVEKKEFQAIDSFCDSDGIILKNLPQTKWQVYFIPQDQSTLLKMELIYKSTDNLEQNIKMGFQEGFTMALGNLDEVLIGLKS